MSGVHGGGYAQIEVRLEHCEEKPSKVEPCQPRKIGVRQGQFGQAGFREGRCQTRQIRQIRQTRFWEVRIGIGIGIGIGPARAG